MNKKITFLILVVEMAVLSLQAQVISRETDREALLGDMQDVIGNTQRESMDFSGVSSPFHERMEPEKKAVAPSSDNEISRTPTVLSDAAALRAIGQRFRPLGSLVLGNRGILQLSNGETIEQGDTFNAEIQGVSYPVVLEEVTQRSYRLRLGTATIEKTFLTGGNQ